jgi:sodium-dependent dicarboxylate transporter 2/3/5
VRSTGLTEKILTVLKIIEEVYTVSNSSTRSKDVKYYINAAISIGIMVFARFIPVSEPFTPEGMMVLGVLIGAIYGFICGNIFWASLMALFMLGLSDVTSLASAFTSSLGHGTVIFLTLLFVFVGYLTSIGFARTLAVKIVRSKLTKGRPWVLTLFLFIAAFVPASVMSITAVYTFMLPLLYSICDEVGYERTDKWPMAVAITLGVAAAISIALFPFQVGLVQLLGFMEAAGFGYGIPFVQWVVAFTVILAVCLVCLTLVIRVFFKPDVSKLYNYTPPEEKVVFTSDQRVGLTLLLILIAVFVIPQFLPQGTAIHAFMAQFGTFSVVGVVLLLGTLFRKNGKPIINLGEAVKGLMIWPLLVMVGTVLVITSHLTRPEFGFVDLIVTYLGPIVGGDSQFVLTVVFMILAIIITTFVGGNLVYAMTIPVLIPIAMAADFNIMQILVPYVMCASAGYAFPSSHPVTALMYGQDTIEPKRIVKYSLVYQVMFFIIAFVIGIPLGLLLF